MQLSAFVDGELPENEAELLLRRLSQDAELRQQVAEFMAIGRAMRGEVQVSGIDQLRERVTDSIGAVPAMEEDTSEQPAENRFARPLAGLAIAATVAVAAIFGLGQLSGGNGVDTGEQQIAGDETPAAYTQAQPEDILEDELLREMRRRHDAVASDQRLSTRVTTVVVPPATEDIEAAGDEPETDEPESDEIAEAAAVE
jgi:negative regulator of sigma E activity